MKKKILYLHVGWSKTGTSAVQSKIQEQYYDFIEAGILYPQSIQWVDNSHHPFALSFMSNGPYKSATSLHETLMKLSDEMTESRAESVLISSELSPFYFEYKEFLDFVDKNFSCIKIIFSLRRQSEILASLFNQLIKDDNIRYRGTIFSLAMNNLEYLDFYIKIKKWSEFVGVDNIIILKYGEKIVDDFLSLFAVKLRAHTTESEIKNQSLPYRCLLGIQEVCKGIDDPEKYKEARKKFVEISSSISIEDDKASIFSVVEQVAFDDYFRRNNMLLEKDFDLDFSEMNRVPYRHIMAIPPGLVNI